MKSTLFVIVVLFSISIASAQTDSLSVKRGYAGITIGPAFPLPQTSHYGSASDKLKGDVKLQLTLVDLGYYFHENFGVAAKWQGAVYNFPTSDLRSHLIYTYPYKYIFDSEEWQHSEILLGFRIAKPKPQSTLSLGVFVGEMKAETPEFSLATDSLKTSYIKNKGTSHSLAIAFDLRYHFHIGKNFDIITGIEYITSHAEYDLKLDAHVRKDPDDEIFKQNIDMVNVNLGVAYRLR